MYNPMSIKDLLGGSMKRAGIEREVSTAQLIQAAEEAVVKLLPTNRQTDARVVSWRDGVLTVSCANSAALHVVTRGQNSILDAAKRRAPKADVRRVVARVQAESTSAGGMLQ